MPNRRTKRGQYRKLLQKNRKANHGRKPNLSLRRLRKIGGRKKVESRLSYFNKH